MIQLLRIDERLIHGQVATAWTRQLGITAVVVANDEAAANELVTMTLRMATPPGIKVAVKTVREAVSLFHDKRTAGLKILIVVDKPRDALKLVRQVPGIPCVNIGNFGRVGDRRGRRALLTISQPVKKSWNSCGKSPNPSAARCRCCRRCPKKT